MISVISKKGEKGDTGANGSTGGKGDKGDKGDQGIQGIQGLKGDTGEQGIQGLKGDTGNTGEQGVQGIQGIQGETGAAGTNGTDGDKGDTGDTGPKGDTGNTGAAGSDAEVTKANVEAVLTGEISTHTHAGGSTTSKEYASFYLSGAGNTGLTSTEVTLTLNATDVNSDTNVFSLTSNVVTVDKAGDFEINVNVYLNNSSTSRTEYSMWIEKNGTEISGTRFASYQRGYDSGHSSGVNLITTLASGDELQIQCIRTDGTATAGYQDANGTRFNIKEM